MGLEGEVLFYLLVILPDQVTGVAGQVFCDCGDTQVGSSAQALVHVIQSTNSGTNRITGFDPKTINTTC